ncbi:hypothetical protein [Hymenobacter sp. CRA2]|uniref:hypothetical protein n=1 Tax=Hymenobacter sp. CRA2 TaxID=1955620 RepID=UPI00098EAB5E|nr:hypothetical protein [Hymenobacter sp. CRA2]OON71098.1 hypothetical protein B0919_03660 [Hymenobacter sp. CRA2]
MALALDITSLDFQQARIKQVLFKSRLRSTIYGVREANTELFERRSNPLAQWLDAVVKPKYGARTEVRQIDRALQQMLDAGHELVRQYQRGQLEEARTGLEQVNAYADRIDALLLSLEQSVV